MVARSRTRIAEIFTEAQSSRSSRKNAILLRQNLLVAEPDEFGTTFLACLNRALICKRSDSNADRIIRFVAHFVALLESDDQDHAAAFGDFISTLIAHLLRGIESKEKNVRYRICQLLAYLLSSGLNEIDEDQFEDLESALIRRVRDKESHVRVQAVTALSRFQAPVGDDDGEESEDESSTKITEMMLHLLGHDPAAEVRRAVLHNLAQSPATLPFLLERARDQDPILRRQIYSTIMPSVNGFKPLSISKRNKLLKWGLKDRDESVRRAADRMFAVDWLNLANGSILELLQRLDVVNSEIAQDAMAAFLRVRPEFIEQSKFDSEFWDELSPESAFLVRCIRKHCSEIGSAELINEKLPELSEICDLIVLFIASSRGQEEAERADTEFVIENLLRLAMEADLRDEIGRRRLTSNIHEILRSDLNESLLAIAIEALSKVALTETELTSTVKDIIVDLYDALEDDREANETFHSADSSLQDNPEKSKSDEDDMSIKYIFTTLRALTIISSLLQNVSSTLISNAGLKSILNDFIVPAVRSHEGPIREKGIDCLGQICLLDRSLAKDNLDLFLHCFARGHEELKLQALKIVTDIIMAHPSILKAESGTEEVEAARELGGEFTPEDDLVRIYLKAFQLQDFPEVAAMATVSVSKLLLFDIIAPSSPNALGLLKELVVMYYAPDNADNQTLRQNLAYFFPVYSFSAIEHQEVVSSICVSVLKRMSKIYDNLDADEKAEVIPLSNVASQVFDWVNPKKLVEGVQNIQRSDRYLLNLFEAVVKRLNTCEKEESRVLASSLSKIFISSGADVEDLIDSLEDALEACHDITAKRGIIKAKSAIEKLFITKPEDPVKPEDTAEDDTVIGDESTVGDTTITSAV